MHPSPCALLGLSLLVACIDAGRPGFRANTEFVRCAQVHAEAAVQPPEAPTEPIPDVWRFVWRRVEAEGAVTHALLGPIRADVRDSMVTPAVDAPAQAILTAARCSHGWVFLTRDAVYASPTFTGRLRLLRSFACAQHGDPTDDVALPTAHLGHERIGITRAGEGAWWSDGQAIQEVPGDGVVGVAWHDASWGARVDRYRTVHATHDGGATWREVDLHDAVPLIVHPREDGFQVETDGAPLRIDADDRLSVASRDDTPAWDPTSARCPLGEGSTRALAALAARAYEAAPRPAASPSACAARHDLLTPAWLPPRLRVRVGGLRATFGAGTLTLDPERTTRAWSGGLRGRAWADTEGAGAMVNVSAPETLARGASVGLSWRGEDALGTFTGRARVRLPFLLADERWNVRTASRAGLLAEVTFMPPVGHDDDTRLRGLLWFSAQGVVRVAEPSPTPLDDVQALALPDGGAVVLGNFDVFAPTHCGHAQQMTRRALAMFQLGVDGTVLWRRVMANAQEFETVLGFGEADGRWGVAVARNGHDAPVELRVLDGRTLPLGPWVANAAPPACGDVASATRIHVLVSRDTRMGLDVVAADIRGGDATLATGRSVTLEATDHGLCIRRIDADREEEGLVILHEDVCTAQQPLRLQARGGALVGVLDEGTRIDHVRATWTPDTAEPR